MAVYLVSDTVMTNIANEIRSLYGLTSSSKLTPAAMVARLKELTPNIALKHVNKGPFKGYVKTAVNIAAGGESNVTFSIQSFDAEHKNAVVVLYAVVAESTYVRFPASCFVSKYNEVIKTTTSSSSTVAAMDISVTVKNGGSSAASFTNSDNLYLKFYFHVFYYGAS